MTKYDTLNYDEFVSIGKNLSMNDMTRVNHDSPDCFGESQSMIVSKNSSGIIHAFCFRCGRRGIYAKDRELITPTKMNGTYVPQVVASTKLIEDIKLPVDINHECREWPSSARTYLRKARVTTDEVKKYKIGYSASFGRLVLPVFKGNILVGYQLRRVLKRDEGPKCITKKHNKFFFSHIQNGKGTCVVVEDLLSCIRVGRHVSSIALFGTSASNAVINALRKYKRVEIWLDDDNEQVRRKQRELLHILENFVDEAVLITGEHQPKDLSEQILKRVLGVHK